ncbi:metal-binding protein [Brachybacterium ginsengisoli]|uniref:Metal-binding protein n=1 Tax=Brachybacterium ginsengisoli TaxID=1331682 RepID=A0A291GWR8_9MICO|nr:YceD family protein [Brachybacterium ginsengisoli]ATG54618.1 metal-binding protein [Brachybacterium ginsengisoli]
MTSENTPTTTLDDALRFDAVDLVGRTGTHRHVERTVAAPPREVGGVAMQVPEGEDIAVEAELESVVEGIYAHGTVTAHLEGECSRCLDPVEQDVTARLDELFMYPEKVKADEREDTTLLEADEVNLATQVRDALAMEADERPLCREDCPGLCAQCGFRMEDDPDHAHDVIDDRFAKLQGLFDDAPSAEKPEEA